MAKLSKNQQKVWDRLKHVPLPKSDFTWTMGSTAPTTPTVGSVYFDTKTSSVMIYDGTEWKVT